MEPLNKIEATHVQLDAFETDLRDAAELATRAGDAAHHQPLLLKALAMQLNAFGNLLAHLVRQSMEPDDEPQPQQGE